MAPMLWRYGTIKAGARLDLRAPLCARQAGLTPPPQRRSSASSISTPSTVGDFCDWAGVAKPTPSVSGRAAEGDLVEVGVGKRTAWMLRRDAARSIPRHRYMELGSSYLGPVSAEAEPGAARADAALRKRLFRPVASPGAVLP